MNQLIFGGSKGVLFQNHLASLSEAITEQLENKIGQEIAEEDIKREIKEAFYINGLNFYTDKAVIEDAESNEIKKTMLNFDRTAQIVIKTYHCRILFTGDHSFLSFRPITFHGFDKMGKIISCSDSNQTFLSYTFQCQENSQQQFNQLKTESLQSLQQNCAEINKEIENWNTKRLDDLINFLYPKVFDYFSKTKEFEVTC